MNVKGKGQRLIPEELLKYLEAYKTAHPDPEAGGGATLDDIVDSQGNKRFVEGTLTDGSTGATLSYKKWSLSGTHLMIVVTGTISSNLETYQYIANATLPTYINSKIFPLGHFAQLISVTKGFFVKDALSSLTEHTFNLTIADNVIYINPAESITISGTYNFRIQFDLLIDSE